MPQFKEGKFSQLFPRDLRQAYQRVRSNPNLLCLEEDVAVIETQQREALAKMDAAKPPPWVEAVEALNDFRTARTEAGKAEALARLERIVRTGAAAALERDRLWRQFNDLAERKEKLITAERNWQAKLRSFYTAEQGLALQHAVVESAKQTFGDDPEKLAEFIEGVLSMFDEPKRIEAEQE